jgi:hypothetical protein
VPRSVGLALLSAALVAAVGEPTAVAAGLRINQLQVVGTHNSYHVEASPAEKALRAGSGLIDETMLEYSFAPLRWQLDRQDAAFIKLNDPTGAGLALIRDTVRRGYVVRTRTDADTREARAGDPRRRRQALASGAQWISTDYPAPGIAARFGSSYHVRLPNHRPARCNPVTATRRCRGARLDRAG